MQGIVPQKMSGAKDLTLLLKHCSISYLEVTQRSHKLCYPNMFREADATFSVKRLLDSLLYLSSLNIFPLGGAEDSPFGGSEFGGQG